MPLALSTRAPAPTSPPPIRETDLDRVLKLVPTEILAIYTAAVPATDATGWRYAPLALFGLGLALVPLVLWLDGRSTRQPARWSQYVVRGLAFVAWANAISSPLAPWVGAYDPSWLRSLAVLLVPLAGAVALREPGPSAPSGRGDSAGPTVRGG